ncbi:Tim44 domain-containing protein [Acinetobacter haemolyticus]|uniref:Tim44 domain-containing protein n=1 Tax=Acinetobacter haemolyticus TaxID=29430 RepID=A0AAJ2YST0_ACIHA|nr:Tim44-like domain-containing protein [Acinetobacter haemolyticus]NAR46143.1 Tim44 domain-containing protein [Acinetobacter haemolyticus]NAR56907.1 Tim44 domain-containing protein [Acinetobacter haemolyticus]NAR71896.1 Tim44 domain-containing protein [Acinetobacter haemolyticus]NAR75284.1 Tim44 domain-containing protein [Acinetobacter haemolyticus]NAR79186.1 Tim44 domain-containing protein [Acinetobacter haemolyticus]
MQVHQRGLMAALLMATLVAAPLAEAKRAGGGKSHGMSRSSSSQSQPANNQSYQQPRQATPAQQQPATAPQKSGPGVGGMVAAGVAGAALGAVAANAMADDKDPAQTEQQAVAAEEEKQGLPSWIWVLLAAAAAFFVFRRLGAKKKLAANNPYAPNNGGPNSNQFSRQSSQPTARQTGDNTNIFGQAVGGGAATQSPFGNAPTQAPFGSATMSSGNQLPDGTEPAAFLRVARQRFNHIQSMNTASNIQEIRRYLTPDLYASMYQDIMANQDQDVAEFSNLNAMVTESTTENGQYIVSVRFTGTVSEDLNSLPQPFTEIWHFVKPAGSQQDWVVAGIQQA